MRYSLAVLYLERLSPPRPKLHSAAPHEQAQSRVRPPPPPLRPAARTPPRLPRRLALRFDLLPPLGPQPDLPSAPTRASPTPPAQASPAPPRPGLLDARNPGSRANPTSPRSGASTPRRTRATRSGTPRARRSSPATTGAGGIQSTSPTFVPSSLCFFEFFWKSRADEEGGGAVAEQDPNGGPGARDAEGAQGPRGRARRPSRRASCTSSR